MARTIKEMRSLKDSWNKVLLAIAKKYHLLPVAREKEVFVLAYKPVSVKRAAS